MSDNAIPKGCLILVSGVTGFIGSHIVDQLLAAGYRVRGTIRSADKAGWITDFFTSRYGDSVFETAVVPDMAEADAFKEAIKGTSGVIHAAHVMTLSANPHEVIPVTVEGGLNALRAAASEPSVKRVVYTSSSTAAVMPNPNKRYHFDATTWNREVKEMVYAPPPYTKERGFPVYAQSKVETEEACWNFMEEQKPQFVLNCVLPNFNIGVILHENIAGGPTGGLVKKVWDGDEEAINSLLHGIRPQYFVPVTDDARLHVAALTDPDVKGERIMAFAQPFNCNDILQVMRKIEPGRKLPDDNPDVGQDLSIVDNRRAVELLQRHYGKEGWDSLEESVRRNVGAA